MEGSGSGSTTLVFSDVLKMCFALAGSVQQPQEVRGSGTRGAHLRTEVCGHCHQVRTRII
jgi:hypothetical protein